MLPQGWRNDLTSTPGEVVMTRTNEGLLITPVPSPGAVTIGDDGFPVLNLGRTVTNDQVLAAIDAERSAP